MNLTMKSLTTAAALGLAAAAQADTETNKSIAVGLLQEALANGNRDYVMTHVSPAYIQHNPAAATGRDGLLGFMDYLQSQNIAVSSVQHRVLAEGDLVMVHSSADFFGDVVIIDLFRFEDGKLAEHWDAIQPLVTETASGRSMVDGATEITDLDQTVANKALVTAFVTEVLMGGNIAQIDEFLAPGYMQHNPFVPDTREGLKGFIAYLGENDISFGYTTLHNVVAEGNFVFTQAEGIYDGAPTAFYDIFRVENGVIVEHWDSVQAIPAEFAHENGMF